MYLNQHLLSSDVNSSTSAEQTKAALLMTQDLSSPSPLSKGRGRGEGMFLLDRDGLLRGKQRPDADTDKTDARDNAKVRFVDILGENATGDHPDR